MLTICKCSWLYWSSITLTLLFITKWTFHSKIYIYIFIYKICQYLLTLMSFQTCKIFIFSKSTTEFHCMNKRSLDILPLLLYSISGKSNVQYMSVNKGWQNCTFWMNYSIQYMQWYPTCTCEVYCHIIRWGCK